VPLAAVYLAALLSAGVGRLPEPGPAFWAWVLLASVSQIVATSLQIHVMAEYMQRALQSVADAVRLTVDYFSLPRDEFIERWLPDREKELERQTTRQ